MGWLDELMVPPSLRPRRDAEPTPTAPPPGKMTRVSTPASTNGPTGERHIDDDLTCEDDIDHIANPDCFLTDAQRNRLVEATKLRILSAQEQYGNALGELRIAELLRPKENPSWLANLALEAVSMVFSAGLSTVGSLVKSAALQSIAGSVADPFNGSSLEPSMYTQAMTAVAKVPGKAAEKAVGVAVGLGKKHVSDKLKVSPEGKDESLAFLDVLANQSVSVFQSIREEGPHAAGTDAGILQLYASWHGDFHTKNVYRKQIQDLLNTFKRAELHQLGEEQTAPLATVDRTLKWRFDFGTGRRRLALYRGTTHHTMKGNPMNDGTPVFSHYVPDALVESAVTLHQARFGVEPEDAT